MLNWRLRYEPFIATLNEQERAPTVLDVGSGWFGLSWYWPHRVVQTDLTFDGGRPIEHRPRKADFVCASADRLPFVDNAFDVVVSSDMLEHLPAELRAHSVVELTRVARRRVIVGFPAGTAARFLDRLYAMLLRVLGRSIPQWLDEHLTQTQYPTRALVEAALPPGWYVARSRRNGNLLLQTLLVIADELPVLRRATRAVEERLANRALPNWLHLPPAVRTVLTLQTDAD